GNEAFLPFVLLSKGPIVVPSTTTISLNSLTKNSAPGGGGGGGKNCDNSSADDGGNGYTGGGEGGQYYFIGPTQQKRAGSGSGFITTAVNQTGDAINGTKGGVFINLHESSGGGTGHPFGKSGTGWAGGINLEGYYGGGTGSKNNDKGGSGGYATGGQGSDNLINSTNNGGKENGNDCGVPLAGGSGGGSGNPQGIGACSGSGGAGGGAIRIYGSTISNINIEAKGADGEGGSPSGGAGSGGMIEINSKLPSGIANLNVSPGVGGGAGRVRNNTPLNSTSNLVSSVGATNYFGFTTDTLTWCNPVFDFKGTCPLNAKVKVFLKAETGSWLDLGYVGTSTGIWSLNVDTKALGIDKETMYYTVARMDVNSPTKSNDFKQDPDYIFSQAAANVFRPLAAPDIDSKTTINYNLKFCKDAEILDSTDITNTGNADLLITFSDLWTTGGKGFKLVGPLNPQTIAPTKSIKIKFKYKPIIGQSGLITDTLIINSNIKNIKKNPWKIALNVNLQTVKIGFEDITNKKIDTVFFKKACLSHPDSVFFNIKNLSNGPFELDQVYTLNTSDFLVSFVDIASSKTMTQNDFRKIRIVFDDKDGNFANISTKLYVSSKDCPEIIDSIIVIIDVIKTELSFANISESDFLDTKIGTSKKRFIKIVNQGSTGAYIKNLPVITPPFKLISTKPVLPAHIKQGDTITLEIDYTPVAEVLDKQNSSISSLLSDTTCDFTFAFSIQGKGIRSLINFPTDTIRFDKKLYCKSAQTLNVAIGNDITSKTNFSITGDALLGVQASSFRIVQRPNKNPYKPGDNDQYQITYDPPKGNLGISYATLEIYTDDDLNKIIKVYLKGELEGLMMSIDKGNPLDFGNVPILSTKSDVVTITNNGTITLPGQTKRSIVSIESKPELKFTPAYADIAPKGGTQVFKIDFTPTVEGPFSSNVLFILGGSDCRDTLSYSVIGNGLKGVVDISGTLDFGYLNPCQSQNGNIVITNTGNAPIVLDTFYLQGGDFNLFSLGSKLSKFTLAKKGDNVSVLVTYAPNGISYGKKSTQIVVLTTANGKQDTTRRNVSVNIISGLDLLPQQLIDFGNEPINFDIFRDITLQKNSNANWTLKTEISNALKQYPLIFKFDKTKLDNYLFGTNNTITITANSQNNMLFEDTLFVPFIMNNDCRDTAYFALKYNAVPAASVKLRLLSAMLFNPEDASSKIPIYGVITSGIDSVKQATFDNINIKFDQNIFYPRSVNKGKILDYKALNGIVTLRIQTDSTLLTKNESLVAEIVGDALIGNKENSFISLDSVINTQKKLISKVDTSIGSISIVICRAGGNRLIDNSKAMSLISMANDDIVQVEANVLEVGKHTLILFDATGTEIQKYEWEHYINESPIYNFQTRIESLANGAYYWVLRSPNRVVTKSIFIIK
ncbi:MAG: choice-of-anchor D domain-containing protein, partial [Candidatus Kapabacteria bacterium]|nr:choice-of-anchor D domain-containing protein [Candidatus Kapabacteria bacterium]